MMLRLIGAGLIMASCGAFGFGMATQYRREISVLRQFMSSLEFMQQEMAYHLSPLPELCRGAAVQCSGTLRKFWEQTACEMESQIAPDVVSCMNAAGNKVNSLPKYTTQAMDMLSKSLGCFDLSGQQKALQSVGRFCDEKLAELEANKPQRIRNYQTLGLCAGAALAILFI